MTPDGHTDGEEESLIHAAKRVLRFLRIDDTKHGGLLSLDTIKAGNLLDRAIAREEKKIRRLDTVRKG